MDFIFFLILILVVLAAVVGFVIKVLIFGFFVKKAIDYWGSYNQEYQSLLSVLQEYSGTGTTQIPDQLKNQMTNSLLQMQNTMSHLDDLQRERADLMMSDMKSQAASVGVFID